MCQGSGQQSYGGYGQNYGQSTPQGLGYTPPQNKGWGAFQQPQATAGGSSSAGTFNGPTFGFTGGSSDFDENTAYRPPTDYFQQRPGTPGFQQQQPQTGGVNPVDPKAWTPPGQPAPGQPAPRQPQPQSNGLPARYNDGFQYAYNQAGGLLPTDNKPQPYRMPDGRMVDLRALNPEGLPMSIDEKGMPRFTPTAMGQSGMDYKQSVGDGFTGNRGGNNWVNGRVFMGSPRYNGTDGGMDPGLRTFLDSYGSRIGGTAANYGGR